VFKGFKRILFILGTVAIITLILSRCMNVADKIPPDVRGENYAGAATCIKCHKDVSQSFAHNAHGLTSKPVKVNELMKVFEPDSNSFIFNEHFKVKVEKRDSGIFQVLYVDGVERRAERFDIAFGSGEKAFTYGFWKGKKLQELPLSYFSVINNWANSPGFPSNIAYYDRVITNRCLECHSTYVKTNVTQISAYEKNEEMEKGSLLYGIDCERCHGPAKEHVVFHLENPEEKTAKFITIFKTLSRKQKIDACSVCHSGNTLTSIKSVFNFQPGDRLEDYYEQDFVSFSGTNPDVHGNQTTMLQGSNCYIKSDMTCQSCHNTHESVKGNMAIYSQRCISCHQTQKHSETTLAKGVLKSNCIDCHMPKQASRLISFKQAGKDGLSPYMLRSHHIAVYPNLK
jgi:mono/diheme cytochrome c family protein